MSDPLVNQIMRISVWVAVAGVLVQVASQLVNYFVFDFEVWNLNVDADNNAFAWASSMAQFAVALCCALLWVVGWWSSPRLVALIAILAFFSLDDIVRIHEQAGSAVRGSVLGLESGYGRAIWPIVFFPLLAAAFILLWRFAERAPAVPAKAIRIGLAMLVLAVFAEGFSTVFHVGADEGTTLQDVIEVAIEESLELAAWVVIAGATAATLCVELMAAGRSRQEPAA